MHTNDGTMEHAKHLDGIEALMVDSDLRSANLVRDVLGSVGASVVTVRSAEEANLMLAATTPDVLLCDLVLPGEDGLSFIRRLRGTANAAIRDVPALAMTAAPDTFDARAAHVAGFDVLVRKPLDPERLSHIVALLVAKGRRARSARDRPE